MSEHSKPLVVDLRKSANDCTLGNERLAKQTLYSLAADEIERLTRDEQEACAAKDAAYKLCDQYTAEIYCLRKALELFMLYHSDTKYATAELHLRAVAAGSKVLGEPKP